MDYYQAYNYVTGWKTEKKCHSGHLSLDNTYKGDSGGKSSTFKMTVSVTLRKKFISTTVGGPGSSVGIATDYGMVGPGSNPGGDEIFRPSNPALGSTQTPLNG